MWIGIFFSIVKLFKSLKIIRVYEGPRHLLSAALISTSTIHGVRARVRLPSQVEEQEEVDELAQRAK